MSRLFRPVHNISVGGRVELDNAPGRVRTSMGWSEGNKVLSSSAVFLREEAVLGRESPEFGHVIGVSEPVDSAFVER
jgi:hypothetical protein